MMKLIKYLTTTLNPNAKGTACKNCGAVVCKCQLVNGLCPNCR